MRGMAAIAVGLVAFALAPAGAAAKGAPSSNGIPLTAPVRDVDPLAGAIALGLRRDRLLTSVVPGPVRNTELVTAGIGPTGAPAVVTDLQQMVVTKPGNYIIRELGPARRAVGLGDTVPPVLELGQVVWQGFSPGTRTLRALLTLDPGIEAHRLPMAVGLAFHDRSGKGRPMRPGGEAPSDGTLTVTLVNQTATPRTIVLGEGSLRPLATALQALLTAARHPHAALPPYAGDGLPTTLPGRVTSGEQVDVAAPLRVTGRIGITGATGSPVQGPGTTADAGGAQVAGTLDGSASFTVAMRAGQRLVVDLDVRPWLDPRLLVAPAASWQQWAASRPSTADVADATRTLAEAAAASARAAEYSPYLQADTPGPDLSTFRYVVAAPGATPRADEAVTAKPAGIAAALVALAAIAGNAALLWRQL